jgi:hypothetical protein
MWIQSTNPSGTAATHEKMAQEYNSIALAVETELVQPRSDRIDGGRFLINISTRMTSLAEHGPSISSDVWMKLNVTSSNTKNEVMPQFEFRLDNSSATVSPDVVARMTDLQIKRARNIDMF